LFSNFCRKADKADLNIVLSSPDYIFCKYNSFLPA